MQSRRKDDSARIRCKLTQRQRVQSEAVLNTNIHADTLPHTQSVRPLLFVQLVHWLFGENQQGLHK